MAHKKSNHRKVLILQEFPSDVMVFEPVKKMSIKKISKDLSKVMKDKNNSRKIIVFDDVSKFLNRKKKWDFLQKHKKVSSSEEILK